MILTFRLVLIVASIILCVTGAFINPPKCNLTSLGIACAILSTIV